MSVLIIQIYYETKDWKNTLKWSEIASKNNSAAAIAFLASIYLDGKIIKRDKEKAYQLYKKASNLGFKFEGAAKQLETHFKEYN